MRNGAENAKFKAKDRSSGVLMRKSKYIKSKEDDGLLNAMQRYEAKRLDIQMNAK
jgi:hypothetical protein